MSTELNFTNFILIGYTAWKGFSQTGRGAVFCHIKQVDLPRFHVSIFHGKYHCTSEIVSTHFLPQKELAAYLHEWMLSPEIMTKILKAVDTYNPKIDMILLVQDGSQIEIDILQKAVMTPRECYQQVRQRWHEFSGYIS
ncbi:hypothetical protein [Calothrix sp. UHCC 0171]|uniref:hypothetical protein n=1 Tax=Calothrix sp. UHCC 0171 TaxID=3110245 RepID=UPI002B216CE1|nr:hypothetical protein [Calothrix sp. UHCC 0171]MEA5571430.1 hypothetical protein [Calothrix sp. UHCC 0171]